MKCVKVLLSGLLISSQLIVSSTGRSLYYEEFKAFKNAPNTQSIFIDYVGESRIVSRDQLTNMSLGAIQRDIITAKSLSLFQMILQYGLFCLDLVIVTPETMPILYGSIDDVFHNAGVATPTIFVTRKKHRSRGDDIFSQKILIFQGALIIGQELLSELSEGELKAAIVREVGAIKYNHFNKKCLVSFIASALLAVMLLDKPILDNDTIEKTMKLTNLLPYSCILGSLMVMVNEWFKKQSDRFACETLEETEDLISYFNVLQYKEQLKKAEFATLYDLLQKNGSRMSILSYLLLLSRYCVAKGSDFLRRTGAKVCSTTPQARIDAAQKYLV